MLGWLAMNVLGTALGILFSAVLLNPLMIFGFIIVANAIWVMLKLE